ncbi:MAG TPA: hypothetical protein VHE35_26670 [Kofleriaceae bacterium]|nr:hypothetical protein [Kofleriaceae bacterium]
MRRWLVLAITLAACGKSADKKDTTSDDKKPAPSESDEPKGVSTKELVAAPLVSTSATAGGKPFTVDLPTSLLKKPEVKDAYATWAPTHEWFDSPGFTVQYMDMPLREGSTGPSEPMGQDAADRKIVRAEALPGGGYINVDQRTDKKFVALQVCRPAPGGYMCCSVTQRADKPIDDFDAAVALYAKICTSLKPGT